MISMKKAGSVVTVSKDFIILFDGVRGIFHKAEKGIGFHCWVEENARNNHRFTDTPTCGDVLHFLTSPSITDESTVPPKRRRGKATKGVSHNVQA